MLNLGASVEVVYLGGLRMNQTQHVCVKLCRMCCRQRTCSSRSFGKRSIWCRKGTIMSATSWRVGGKCRCIFKSMYFNDVYFRKGEKKICQVIIFVLSNNVVRGTSNWNKVHYKERNKNQFYKVYLLKVEKRMYLGIEMRVLHVKNTAVNSAFVKEQHLHKSLQLSQ